MHTLCSACPVLCTAETKKRKESTKAPKEKKAPAAKKPKKEKREGPPVRPVSSYLQFCKVKRPEVIEEEPGKILQCASLGFIAGYPAHVVPYETSTIFAEGWPLTARVLWCSLMLSAIHRDCLHRHHEAPGRVVEEDNSQGAGEVQGASAERVGGSRRPCSSRSRQEKEGQHANMDMDMFKIELEPARCVRYSAHLLLRVDRLAHAVMAVSTNMARNLCI